MRGKTQNPDERKAGPHREGEVEAVASDVNARHVRWAGPRDPAQIESSLGALAAAATCCCSAPWVSEPRCWRRAAGCRGAVSRGTGCVDESAVPAAPPHVASLSRRGTRSSWKRTRAWSARWTPAVNVLGRWVSHFPQRWADECPYVRSYPVMSFLCVFPFICRFEEPPGMGLQAMSVHSRETGLR